MASIWMLSKDAMRGMNIIGAISDFLDEHQAKRETASSSRNRVLNVLRNIATGARSFIDSNVRIDSFSMIVAEAVYTDMSKTPTELISIIENCIERLDSYEVDQDSCLDVLRIIAKNTSKVTSRRVDTESLILH